MSTNIAKAYVSGSGVDNSSILVVDLLNGQRLTTPIEWFPRLAEATIAERNHIKIIGGGQGIHWPLLDEDISLEGLLKGQRSEESQSSLAKWRDWLKNRRNNEANVNSKH